MTLQQIAAPMLHIGRGAALPGGTGRTVPELIAECTAARPGDIAVECAGTSLTYHQLDLWAGRIAARLAENGVGRGDRVGVLVEPSAAMVAAALGVLRAGAAYVPVDASHPDRQIAARLADARVRCVLTDSAAAGRAGDVPVVRVEDTTDGPVAPAAPVRAEDPAYLIYTSGTTGEPKGVLVEHGQLAASTLARHRVYPGRPVFLLVSPLAFDSSVAGLWGTLTTGGRLVVATGDEVRDPARLTELVRHHRVTRLLCVPALYGVLLDAAARAGGEPLQSLDTVTVAGEALPEPLVARHFRACPGTALVNEYGPTEATVWATYHRLTEPGPVSIGRPVPGAVVYLLDGDLQPVPSGMDGELYVGGAGVARGYFGRPEATGEVFVTDPFTGDRMYRTGDIARWTTEGTLEFRGRRDQQVKIRGHRVELGAVEAALCAVPGVRDAAVVLDETGTRLCGYVLADPEVSGATVRELLAESLPAAMVPGRVDVLDRFPLTVNGKVDRAALAQAAPAPAVPAQAEPADTATAKVAAAWAEVLNLPSVPPDVNFFELGGHSLTMFQLQDALESHTGNRPSIVALFRHTTVAAQAALISEGGTGRGEARGGTRRAAAMAARRRRAAQEVAS
jgi:amino acid adenylation domain-containing protein